MPVFFLLFFIINIAIMLTLQSLGRRKIMFSTSFISFVLSELKKLIILELMWLHNTFTTYQPQKSRTTHVGNIKLYLMARSNNTAIIIIYLHEIKVRKKYFMIDQLEFIESSSSLHILEYMKSLISLWIHKIFRMYLHEPQS